MLFVRDSTESPLASKITDFFTWKRQSTNPFQDDGIWVLRESPLEGIKVTESSHCRVVGLHPMAVYVVCWSATLKGASVLLNVI